MDNCAPQTEVLSARVLVGYGWDAVSDPIMGYVADRGYERWGRYRPYLWAGAVPLGLSFALCFYSPGMSPSGKVAWALATYLLLSTFFSMTSTGKPSRKSKPTSTGNDPRRL